MDHLELMDQLRKVFLAEPDQQTDAIRTWFKRMRSHLGLVSLNGNTNPKLQNRLNIVEKVLAFLPPEEKKYPSDKQEPTKTPEPVGGFFQKPG